MRPVRSGPGGGPLHSWRRLESPHYDRLRRDPRHATHGPPATQFFFGRLKALPGRCDDLFLFLLLGVLFVEVVPLPRQLTTVLGDVVHLCGQEVSVAVELLVLLGQAVLFGFELSFLIFVEGLQV